MNPFVDEMEAFMKDPHTERKYANHRKGRKNHQNVVVFMNHDQNSITGWKMTGN